MAYSVELLSRSTLSAQLLLPKPPVRDENRRRGQARQSALRQHQHDCGQSPRSTPNFDTIPFGTLRLCRLSLLIRSVTLAHQMG